MATRFQQCLHQGIIDTSLVNRVARKFWQTENDSLDRPLNLYSLCICLSFTHSSRWVLKRAVNKSSSEADEVVRGEQFEMLEHQWSRVPAFELFHEFHFGSKVDVPLVATISQKAVDRCASSVTVIPGKFIHVHADELAGELRVHVACVCERMSDGFVPMCQTIVNAFSNDLAKVASHGWRDIFAHHVSA